MCRVKKHSLCISPSSPSPSPRPPSPSSSFFFPKRQLMAKESSFPMRNPVHNRHDTHFLLLPECSIPSLPHRNFCPASAPLSATITHQGMLLFTITQKQQLYPRSHTGKAGCAQPAMSTKYHDSQESPIMWVNHQQIEVNRIRHGFFEEIQLSVFYSSTLSENGLVILRKVNRNGNGSLALALGTSKTFLFFGEHGTLVAQAWDWDSNRDGVKS